MVMAEGKSIPMVTETVCRLSEGDHNWPPEDLGDFIVWLKSMHGKIPKEFRSSSKITIDSRVRYCDDSAAGITIEYDRPKTLQEIEASRQKERQNMAWEADNIERRLDVIKHRMKLMEYPEE